MGIFVMIGGGGGGRSPTSRLVGARRTPAATKCLARREPDRPLPLRRSTSCGRPILVLACALLVAFLAASCGGSEDGDRPEPVEVSEVEGDAEDDGDGPAGSRDESESEAAGSVGEDVEAAGSGATDAADGDGVGAVADEAEEPDLDDDRDLEATTPAVQETQPAPHYESAPFASAYDAAREAHETYVATRGEEYFAALGNAANRRETTDAALSDASADASESFDRATDEAHQTQLSKKSGLQAQWDTALASFQRGRDEVPAILEVAIREAQWARDDAYTIWNERGRERGHAAGSTYQSAYDEIGRIAAKTAGRMAYDAAFLAALDQALANYDDPPILTALVAFQQSFEATLADNPLPYESADSAIDTVISELTVVESYSNKDDLAERIEERLDVRINYTAPASDAATLILDEVEATERSLLAQRQDEELTRIDSVYNQALADATADRDAAISRAENAYRAALAAIDQEIEDSRSAFDFDAWVSAAFALADTYIVLYDVAVAVESEAQFANDGSLAASSAFDYASTVRRELGAVAAAAANSLADGYSRRTVLDVESEFAQAAEALFLEAEFFEDALEAARSRAEARAKAING